MEYWIQAAAIISGGAAMLAALARVHAVMARVVLALDRLEDHERRIARLERRCSNDPA